MRRLLFLLLALAALSYARAGGGCFLPGTEVSTPGGPVPIEGLQPGAAVLSFSGSQIVQGKVAGIYSVRRDYYYTIRTEKAEVNVTAEHPFFVGDGYEEASSLKAGDTVYLLENGQLRPAKF